MGRISVGKLSLGFNKFKEPGVMKRGIEAGCTNCLGPCEDTSLTTLIRSCGVAAEKDEKLFEYKKKTRRVLRSCARSHSVFSPAL